METTKTTTSENLIASAKNKLAGAKASKEDFRKIPLAPLYEINTHGAVRTIDKKTQVIMKKGTGKFYLRVDTKGNRKLFSPEQIAESLGKTKAATKAPAKAKTVKTPKAASAAKTTKASKPTGSINEYSKKVQDEIKAIAALDATNYVKVYKLNKMNFSNAEIAGFIGITPGNAARALRHIRIGRVKV